jgi:hypothetical protein
VTTTHPGIAGRAQVQRTVGVLHPDNAVDVLQEWANDDDAPRQTVSLMAWRLGYQALPLALVGAMVPVFGSWRSTLEALETQRVDLSAAEELTPEQRLMQIYAVFNLCFATLSQQEQSHTRTLAHLAERRVPLTLVTIGQALGFDASTPQGETATRRAVNALRRRAILAQGAWHPTPTLRLHPLLTGYCLT